MFAIFIADVSCSLIDSGFIIVAMTVYKDNIHAFYCVVLARVVAHFL